MRRVTGHATFGLGRLMLEDERACFFDVTLEADGVLRRCRPQLLCQESAVLIVAISTLHQVFIHAMPERLREIDLGFEMARIAQCGLFLGKQELRLLSEMRRMAGNASNIISIVLRALEVAVLLTVFVAPQTPRGCFTG